MIEDNVLLVLCEYTVIAVGALYLLRFVIDVVKELFSEH
jgi:hypothetical protein